MCKARKSPVIKVKKKMLFLLLGSAGCWLLSGCAEASFRLSDQSRLPIWVKLPPNTERRDVSLTLDNYVFPFGPSARLTLTDKQGKVLQKFTGTQTPVGDSVRKLAFPSYDILEVGGVTEVIEHRAPEPVFYVTDDPVIRSKMLHQNH